MNIRAATESDLPAVRELFIEYQQWLDIDLCFQNFAAELANLPGCYAPPRGAILIAEVNGCSVGCVCLRPHEEKEAELKRLFVQQNSWGQGIGRALFDAVMQRAAEMGYDSIVLDTLPTMAAARTLYLGYGFKQIPAYYHNPEPGAEYYRYSFKS